ncbi:hypothetical protein D3C87_104900 [compost metagenome]
MSLEAYFKDLIEKVENSTEITNQGKDENGFYKPTRTILLRHLNLLKDLHGKPMAKAMVQSSWRSVVEMLPPDWLVLSKEDREELKRILE